MNKSILFFAYVSLAHNKEMVSTTLGRGIGWFIIVFYSIRIVSQAIFWDVRLMKSIAIIAFSIVLIGIYLMALIRQRNIPKNSS